MAASSIEPVPQDERGPTPQISVPDDRMQSLDALRVTATFLVILLHVSIAYLPVKLSGLVWPVHDPQPGRAISAMFWGIESTIMPLFFLIAGFCAGLMSLKMTAGKFLKHRRKRLLNPLLLGCVLILPLDLYAWTLGLVIEGDILASCFRTFDFPRAINDNIWGLSHLWFLQYLLLYSIGFGGFLFWKQRKERRTKQNDSSPPAMEKFFRSRWMLPVLIVPCCLVLGLFPEVVTGFQHGFLPIPAKFVYTVPFFLAGLAIGRQRIQYDRICRHRNRYLFLAAFSFPFMLMLIEKHFAGNTAAWERIGLAPTIVMFAWTASLGLFALFMQADIPPNRQMRYLADASFWVYLIHHPIVGLAQTSLSLTSLGGAVKFLLATAIVTTLSLGSYHVFVRQRPIGFLLGEKRLSKDTESSKAFPRLGEPAPIERQAA